MVIPHETGAFALAIGTSLAIEGLVGVHPGKPNQPSGHRAINALWVNVRTLVRNYYQSVKSADAERIKFPDAALVVFNEIQALPDILRSQNKNIEIVFYHQPMENIKQQFPNANYRKAKTDKQVFYQRFEDITLIHVLAECKNAGVKVEIIKNQPVSGRKIVAILSHIPKDLFWKSSFERMFLLESHTGKLKTYVDWYTKLQGVKSDNPLPLNEFTLQVFGDAAIFDSQDKKIRAEVKQLAAVKRWNGSTSAGKVKSDILGYGSSLLKETYRKLLP